MRTADTYLTFATPFGEISVEPGDDYNVGERNQLEQIKRYTFSPQDGTFTVALLEVQVEHSGEPIERAR